MSLKQRIPFLRWSVWRLAVGNHNLTRTGQIGDGREAKAVEYVQKNARAGDVDDVLATIDRFAYEKAVLVNVGDEKGALLDALAGEHGFGAGALDFLFLDHDKNAYLTDLQSILDRGWLHPGSIVVADNVKLPGAPKYRAYMREQQGNAWNTVEHKTHVEYQTLVADLVLESEYLGS